MEKFGYGIDIPDPQQYLEETSLLSFLNIFAPFLLRQMPPASTGRNITSHTERCKPKRSKEEHLLFICHWTVAELMDRSGGGM